MKKLTERWEELFSHLEEVSDGEWDEEDKTFLENIFFLGAICCFARVQDTLLSQNHVAYRELEEGLIRKAMETPAEAHTLN